MKTFLLWAAKVIGFIVAIAIFFNLETDTRIQVMLVLLILGIYSLMEEVKDIKNKQNELARRVESLHTDVMNI